MNDIMIDLETMGTSADAAIIAIGACKFSLTHMTVSPDSFYEIVDLQSSVDAGLTIDASTVIWWMKQSDEARSAFDRTGSTLSTALQRFTSWVVNPSKVKIWGCGASFDNIILSTAYRKLQLNQPWEFWNDRCYRTLKAERPDIKMKRQGTYHNALNDAVSQAHHLIEICNN